MALPFPNSYRPETWKGPRSQQFPKREDAFQQLVGDLLREALPGGAFPVRTSGPDGSIDAFLAQDASLAPLFQHLPGPVIVECKDNDDTLPQVQKNVLGAWTKVKAKLAEQADKGWPDRFAPWREARGYLFLTSAVFPDTESRRQLERTLQAFFDTLRAEGKCQIEQVRVADWSDLRDALDRWPRVADRWLGVGLRKVVGHDEHKEVLAADFRRFLLAEHLPFCAPEPRGSTHPHTLFQSVMDRAMTGGVLVTGSGGVGKTRLLVEVGELAHTRGLRVLHVLPGEPALEHEELFERVLQGQQDTLLLFDYVDEASIDFDAVRRHLLPEASSRNMRVGVLASARSRRNVQRRNDRGAFFEHLELRLDDERAGRLLSQMRLCVAPTATALLGERAVIELAGTRPIIALLVLRELERRAALGQLRESSLRGIRSGDLVGWLRRRLAEDELLVRPAASPWEEDEIPPRLVATAAILASSPQGEEALRAVALLATRGLPRGEQLAQRAVPALVELGWLEEREGGFSAVHDVIVDEVLGQTLGDASGALRQDLLWRLLEPGKLSARTLICLVVSFRRLVPDVESAPSGFGAALAEALREWLTRSASDLGALLVDAPPSEGSFLLAALLYGGVWTQAVTPHWDTLVIPWLGRHATHPDARHLLVTGLGQLEARGRQLVAPALHWLTMNGRGIKASFVLSRLLGREDLSPEEVSSTYSRALPWLDLHGLHLEARYVLFALLKREDLLADPAATVRARAFSWLKVHAGCKSADFVLRLLLGRSELSSKQSTRVVAHALTWLGAHGHLLDAQFILHALLRHGVETGVSPTGLHAIAMRWLGSHRATPEAGFVLAPLLMTRALPADLLAATLAHTREWLRVHGERADVRFVLRALLERGPSDASDTVWVTRHAVAWLEVCITQPFADVILGALLARRDLGPGDAERVKAIAGRWLELFGTTASATFILKDVFRRQDLSAAQAVQFRGHAFSWLDPNGVLPNAQFVLNLLFAREDLTPEEAASLRRRALAWLSVHEADLSACYVLPHLLARSDLLAAESERALVHALTWLRACRGRVEAGFVLEALLGRQDLTPRVAREALAESVDWLKGHLDHSRCSYLLRFCLWSPHLQDEWVERILDVTAAWAETRPPLSALSFVLYRALRFRAAPSSLVQRVARLGVEWLKAMPHDPARHHMLKQVLPHCALLSASELEFLVSDAVRWVKAYPPEKVVFQDLMRTVRRVASAHGIVVKLPNSGWKPPPDVPSELRALAAELKSHLPPVGEPASVDFLRDTLRRVRERSAAEVSGGCTYALSLLLPLVANTADLALLDDVESSMLEHLQANTLEPYQVRGLRKGCLRLIEEGAWKDEAQGRRSLQRLGLVQPEPPEG